jgi:hypothetical protein
MLPAHQSILCIRLISNNLNEVRQSTECIIDDLCDHAVDLRQHPPRYDRGKARANFLNEANQKKLRSRKIKAAICRQLDDLPRNLHTIDTLLASSSLIWFSGMFDRLLVASGELLLSLVLRSEFPSGTTLIPM